MNSYIRFLFNRKYSEAFQDSNWMFVGSVKVVWNTNFLKLLNRCHCVVQVLKVRKERNNKWAENIPVKAGSIVVVVAVVVCVCVRGFIRSWYLFYNKTWCAVCVWALSPKIVYKSLIRKWRPTFNDLSSRTLLENVADDLFKEYS